MYTKLLSHVWRELAPCLPDLPAQLGPRWSAFRRRLQGILTRAARVHTNAEAEDVLQSLAALFREHGLDVSGMASAKSLLIRPRRDAITYLLIHEVAALQDQPSQPLDLSAPDFLALAQALASRVTRYLDVYCPRQVALNTARFPITVGLTIQQVAASALAQALNVWPGDEPVTVLVRPDPAGLEVLGADEASLTVYKDRDSPPVTFYLRPRRAGAWDVTLEFHQRGRRLGVAKLRPEVVEGQPVDEPLPQPQASLSLLGSEYLPVPDVDLRIRRRDQGSVVTLEFEVNSLLLNRHAFRNIEPLTLTASPAQWQADTFAHLSKMAATGTGDGHAELERIGQRIYRDLFPPGLKALYAELRQRPGATILITSDEPWIPWELAWPYDVQSYAWKEESPLGVRYRMGRWLASGRSTPFNDLRVSSLACVAPGSSGLPSVAAERLAVQALASGLARTVGTYSQSRTWREPVPMSDAPAAGLSVRDLSPDPATLAKVSALLEDDCDLLHFACHGQYFQSDPLRSALLLDDGKLLAGDIVGLEREGAIHRNRPLVFFNACEVGCVGYGLTGVGGWARAFVEPGCGAFIAPLWEVEDRMAAAFATAFYERIRGHDSLGEALVAARDECRDAEPDNPTWLAYTLYGHPAARVRFGE